MAYQYRNINFVGKGVNIIGNSGQDRVDVNIASNLLPYLPDKEPVFILHIGDYNGRTNELMPDATTVYPVDNAISHWTTNAASTALAPPQSQDPADYQWRIYRNDESIKWKNRVHEVLDGYKTLSHLPQHPEWCLKHHKTIERQERQNSLYDTL